MGVLVGLCLLSPALEPAQAQYGKGGYGFNPGYDQFGLYAFGWVNHEYGWAYYPGPGMTRPDHRPPAVRERAASPARKSLARFVSTDGGLIWPWHGLAEFDRPLDRERLQYALRRLTDDAHLPTATDVATARGRLKDYGDGMLKRIQAKRPGFDTRELRSWLDRLDRVIREQPTAAPTTRKRR
jgi:hypothetical protein